MRKKAADVTIKVKRELMADPKQKQHTPADVDSPIKCGRVEINKIEDDKMPTARAMSITP